MVKVTPIRNTVQMRLIRSYWFLISSKANLITLRNIENILSRILKILYFIF